MAPSLATRALWSAGLFVGYLAVGAACYTFIFEKWTLVDAVYFTMVTLTTVGYGDVCPSSRSSKAFTVLFSLLGVVQIGVALEVIAEYFLEVREKLETKNRIKREARMHAVVHSLPVDVDLAEKQANQEGLKRVVLALLYLVLAVMSVAVIQLILEPSWTLIDSIYFSVITATTIGYGDLSPTSEIGRFLAVFYIPACLGVVSYALGVVAEEYFRIISHAADVASMEQEFDETHLPAMDADSDGRVDEYEFTKFMLQSLGRVDEDTIKLIEEEFDRLDSDGSGFLDWADIVGEEADAEEAHSGLSVFDGQSAGDGKALEEEAAQLQQAEEGEDLSTMQILVPAIGATVVTAVAVILSVAIKRQ